MNTKLLFIAPLMLLVYTASAQKKGGMHVISTHPILSGGGYDYLTVDQQRKNLFVSHGNQVNILSLTSGDSVGVIRNTPGAHGITLLNDLGKGYITNGKGGTCTVFDLKSFKTITGIKVGLNPDATLYDPYAKKVIVFNGRSKDASIIDPQTDQLIATIALGGKPEAGVSDLKGKVYVNIEDTGEIVCISTKTFRILSRYKLKGGEEPSGIALDQSTSRLFVVCANKLMIILDATTGQQIASLPIGEGADGVVFDPVTKMAYSSNGEGTITAVKEVSANKFIVADTIPTLGGARTIALDMKSHHLYLPAADFTISKTPGGRPEVTAGTFKVLEVGL